MGYQEGRMPLKGTVTSLEGTMDMTLSQELDTTHRGDRRSVGGFRKSSFSWEKSMWQKPSELTYRQQGRGRNVQYWPPLSGLGDFTGGNIEGRGGERKQLAGAKYWTVGLMINSNIFSQGSFIKMKAIKVNPGDQRMSLTWINEDLPRHWGLFINSEKLEEEEGWRHRV